MLDASCKSRFSILSNWLLHPESWIACFVVNPLCSDPAPSWPEGRRRDARLRSHDCDVPIPIVAPLAGMAADPRGKPRLRPAMAAFLIPKKLNIIFDAQKFGVLHGRGSPLRPLSARKVCLHGNIQSGESFNRDTRPTPT